jgi:gamma-tubulin complex component 2
MLVDWISSGHLTDKYDEFLVREATSISKKALESDFTDEYWERRYTVRLFPRAYPSVLI